MSILKSFDKQPTLQSTSFFERLSFLRKKFVPIVVIIFLVGIVGEVYCANRLSTVGGQIAKIQDESTQLTLENQLLQDQIARKSSFNQVEQHAQLLGFTDIKNVQYIQPVDLAFNH